MADIYTPVPWPTELKYTIRVDGSRTDDYTPDGSDERPFKNLKDAMIYLRDFAPTPPDSTHRYNVQIASGFYYEDNPIPVVNYVYVSGEFKHNPRIIPMNNDKHLFEFASGYSTCDYGELTFQAPAGDLNGQKAVFYAGPGTYPVCGIYFCLFLGADSNYSEAIHNTESNSGFHLVSCMAYGAWNDFMHIDGGNYADDGMIIHTGTSMENYIHMIGQGQIEMSEVECNSDLVTNMFNINHINAKVRATDVVFNGTNALKTGPNGGIIEITACDMNGANIIDGGDISIYASTFNNNSYITALTGNCSALKIFNCQNINTARTCVEMTGNNSIFYSSGNYFTSPSGVDAIILTGTFLTADVEGTKQFRNSSLLNGANLTFQHYPDANFTRIVQVSGYDVGGIGSIYYLTADEANYYQEDDTKTSFIGDRIQLEGIGLMPYAWWHLNSTTGNIAYDSSGYNRNGTLVNMETGDWVLGKLNNCLVFDGVNEYVNLGGIAKFDWNNLFSLEFWFKSTDTNCFILSNKAEEGNSKGYGVALNASGQIITYFTNKAGSNEIIKRTDAAYNDDAWHHVVVTYGGTGTAVGVIIYIDNTTPATTTLSDTLGTSSMASATDMQMSGNNGLNNLYTGYVDETVIYDVVLSPAEVSVRWNMGIGSETMPGNYDITQGWYITTLNASQVNTSAWNNIVSALVDDATPVGTYTKYLVSVDNRTSWYYWNAIAGIWSVCAISDIDLYGNTAAELQAVSKANWDDLFVPGTLDVAVSLRTTNNLITPSVNKVEFAYSDGERRQFNQSEIKIEYLNEEQTKFTNISGNDFYDLKFNIFKRETY